MDWKKLNKSQRMQLKALACILGILLLLLLLLARLCLAFFGEGKEPWPDDQPASMIRFLQNVWVMEVDGTGLKVFEEGKEDFYLFGEGVAADRSLREQVADIILINEKIAAVHSKTEKISGRVLSVDESGIVLEGEGRYDFAPEMKVYRIFSSLSERQPSDLVIGYDFADFVLQEGKICAILLAREEAMESIRVLLKNSDYGGLFHPGVELTCDTEYILRYGEGDQTVEELHQAGEICRIEEGSTYFQGSVPKGSGSQGRYSQGSNSQGGGSLGSRIAVIPTVLTGKVTLLSVSRSQGTPSYRGRLEFLSTASGIVVINELPLEEYLYSVVPSEMPASYPREALKAQAVSARTYAYRSMLHAGYPQYGAHVDDSTSYQVYNNILEQEAATTAVKETYGQLLYREDGETLVETYYYSTSCGMGTDESVWSTEEKDSYLLKPMPVNRKTMALLKEERESIANRAEDAGSAEGIQAEAESEDGEGLQAEEVHQLEEKLQLAERMKEEEAFRSFIMEKSEDDYEVSESLYRWQYQVKDLNEEKMLANLQARYQANPGRILVRNSEGEFVSSPISELGSVTDLYVAKRGAGGIAKELVIVTDRQTIKVLTEYNIRCILNDGETKVLRQNGKESDMPSLLPSAFLVIDLVKEGDTVAGYTLTGGGYGHGAGMSQNGAKCMAQDGCSMEDILMFFYQSSILKRIYE